MAATPLESGSVVGRRYRLERELTRQGGMGVVWTAIHLVTKRRVAIKLLRGGAHDDAASRARLLREARASCAVDHPSVLPVLDVIDADGAPALVMELLEGESLRERLDRRGALGVRETCTILARVASALAAAHAARVVHRDIKPENIFLVGTIGAEPTVKVLDFGIAKIVATEEPTTDLTETGAMLGTPYYMSPEQAFGERDVGPATDAWALGVVLYECLDGARPTQAENLGQVIKRITQDLMTPVEERVAGVPIELASLVARLLQRDVAAREVDMARVATTLAECAENRGEAGAVALGAPRTGSRRVASLSAAIVVAATACVVAVVAWKGAAATHADGPAPLASIASSVPVASSSSSASDPPTISATPAPQPSVAVPSVTVPSVVVRPSTTSTGSLATTSDASGGAAAIGPSSASAEPHRPATDDGGTIGPGHVIIKTPF